MWKPDLLDDLAGFVVLLALVLGLIFFPEWMQ